MARQLTLVELEALARKFAKANGTTVELQLDVMAKQRGFSSWDRLVSARAGNPL